MAAAGAIEQLRAQAQACQSAGRLEEAEQLCRRILEIVPGDLEARHMIGVLRLQQGRAEDALQIVAPLAAEAPGHADIRTHHGLALQFLGRAEEALADFDPRWRSNPAMP